MFPLSDFPGNETAEMEYLNSLISRWMPPDSKRVAVDSHPRLSGIMDTINATLAHGPSTRLPKEFYDNRGRQIIDKICVEEWFIGYKESTEYRQVGIGSLLGDLVSRMVTHAEQNGDKSLREIGGETESLGHDRGGKQRIKFGMSGCHDTTLAAVLSSLGTFDSEQWPPYTSHIALELFKRTTGHGDLTPSATSTATEDKRAKPSVWSSLFSPSKPNDTVLSKTMARKTVNELTVEEKKRLDDYYVRIRYNDMPMAIPGCKMAGNHLEGDESFCTLVGVHGYLVNRANVATASVQENYRQVHPEKLERGV
jgi:acid phosphatase